MMMRRSALRFARLARPHQPSPFARLAYESPRSVRSRGGSLRGLATQQKDEKEPSRWERIRTLFREHGVAFAALYCGAYTATFVPLMAALTVGGVDGPELVLWGAEQMQLPYDLSWIQDGGPLSNKDLINAFIALELNGWVEPLRLPLVMAATPKASAWLKERRGG